MVLVVRILPWVHLFRVPRSWTGSVQIKSSMTFTQGNRCIEREKDTFKSRRCKECALALMDFVRKQDRFADCKHKTTLQTRFASILTLANKSPVTYEKVLCCEWMKYIMIKWKELIYNLTCCTCLKQNRSTEVCSEFKVHSYDKFGR